MTALELSVGGVELLLGVLDGLGTPGRRAARPLHGDPGLGDGGDGVGAGVVAALARLDGHHGLLGLPQVGAQALDLALEGVAAHLLGLAVDLGVGLGCAAEHAAARQQRDRSEGQEPAASGVAHHSRRIDRAGGSLEWRTPHAPGQPVSGT